jgi:hypothetical protein
MDDGGPKQIWFGVRDRTVCKVRKSGWRFEAQDRLRLTFSVRGVAGRARRPINLLARALRLRLRALSLRLDGRNVRRKRDKRYAECDPDPIHPLLTMLVFEGVLAADATGNSKAKTSGQKRLKLRSSITVRNR